MNSFKRLWNSSLIIYLRRWVYILLACVLSLIFTAIFIPNYTNVFISAVTSIFVIFLIIDILKLATKCLNYFDERKYNKIGEFKEISLYRWIGDYGVDEKFLFYLLNSPTEPKLLSNLKNVKENILKVTNHEHSNLVLLKTYLDVYEKNDILERVWKVTSIAVVAIITGLITKVVTTDNFINLILQYFPNSVGGNRVSFFTNYVNYSTYIIIGLIFFIFTWGIFTKTKRRIQFVKGVVENIIEEKEKEK